MELIELDSRETYALACWRGVILYHWRGQAPLEGARELHARVAARREADPSASVLTFGFVDAGTKPPSSEVRRALADGMNEGRGLVRASAVVIPGDGVSASMARGVATGLTALARPTFPHRFFGTVELAATWLSTVVLEYDPDSLTTALGTLMDTPPRRG